MSSPAPVLERALVAAHPNELDLRRIERTLRERKRYRYVEPRVLAEEDGYRVECACCSRTIRPDGGIVDIALIRWEELARHWRLFRKNHGTDRWELDGVHARLFDLLARLNADPERRFWQ